MKKIIPIDVAKVLYKDDMPYLEQHETFFPSSFDAISEKRYVFFKANNLKQQFTKLENNKSFIIGEIGFDLGLNFLLTWQLWLEYAPSNCHLHFVSTQLHPIQKKDLINFLRKFPEISFFSDRLITQYPLLTPGMHRLNFGNVSLTLLLGDAVEQLNNLVCDENYLVQQKLRDYSFDCWYLSCFTLCENNFLWTQELFKTIKFLSSQQSTLSSFYVNKTFKQSLVAQGFKYKTEVIKNIKKYYLCIELAKEQLDIMIKPIKQGKTPWNYSKTKTYLTKKNTIAIVGAGLAGCIMANKLAERGYLVTVFDKQSHLASQGSGNGLGLVHFKLSSYQSSLNDFMLSAYLYALKFYDSLSDLTIIKGIADLLDKEQLEKKKLSLGYMSQAYPELIKFCNAQEISHIANIKLKQGALLWPQALTISPVEICNKLIKHKNIIVKLNQNIRLNELDFDKIIIAAGVSSNNFVACKYLSLEAVGGMVSYFQGDLSSKMLKISLSSTGYITPASIDGKHLIGGSYHLNDYKLAHVKHLQYVVDMSINFENLNCHDAKYKYGERAKTYDYLPFVGAVPKVKEFYKQYKSLVKDKNMRIAAGGPYHKSLYILAGFGSHGLTTIPLSAEILLNQILNEPQPISSKLLRAVSPARPLIRNIIKNQFRC